MIIYNGRKNDMNKKMKKFGCGLALTASLIMLGGCGRVKPEDIIDKYAGMCELGEYKNIEYIETKTEITDSMVDSKVQEFLSGYAVSETLTSGTAEMGDQVNIDYVGYIDDETFENGSGTGYSLTLGSGTMIDGFEEQIAGHDVGETFDIKTSFPDEYPNNPDLAGVPVVFEITLNSITRTTIPDYTDAFVASNTDAAGIEDYEQSIREELETTYAEIDERYNKSAVMQVVLENANISEYPEQEMQELFDSTMDDVQAEADQYGYDLATYVSARYGYAEDDFRAYVSSLVEDFMREKIVVCAVAKAEGITVTKDEIKAYKAEMMESSNITDEDTFDEYYSEEDITYYTIADKVVEFLLENAVPTVATDTDALEAEDTTTVEDASETDATPEDAE